jgi:hypothetical protein
MGLLTNREYKVTGSWYAPEHKLREYPSVRKVEYIDMCSSAGDWSGYFIQRIRNKEFLIFFHQENNYPREGYTLYTEKNYREVYGNLEEILNLVY